MKDFKQHILEKLKVNANKNHDPRDYETVDMLSANALDKRKFREYLQDCLKRDKYEIQSSDFEFHNTKVLYYYDKYLRSLCSYSVNDTYIDLYDRIIDTLKEDHFINEKLKISSNRSTGYTLFPETPEELDKMVELEIKNNGPNCSLNHIDVSGLKDLSYVFSNSKFNGDISKWDVSNVEDMYALFRESDFTGENGDISGWDVSNVTCMRKTFKGSKFNVDISDWDVSNVTDMKGIFTNCPLQNNPPKWYKE